VEVVAGLLDALQVANFQAVADVRRSNPLRTVDAQAPFGALQWDRGECGDNIHLNLDHVKKKARLRSKV
jgi:hypothetical protein